MKLSIREKEILDLLIQGKLNKEIALLLFISEETVKKHLKNVYRKLGVRNRVEATLKTYKFR
jgi:DNA-binding CsgD family transcriptional regulator